MNRRLRETIRIMVFLGLLLAMAALFALGTLAVETPGMAEAAGWVYLIATAGLIILYALP